MKRELVCVLCLALLSGTVSCSRKQASVPESTSSAHDIPTVQETAETEAAFTGTSQADMQGRDFTIYSEGWYDYEPLAIDDIFVEELTGDAMNDAVYNRNLTIENGLQCHVVHVPYPDTDHLSALSNSISAGDQAYDICLMRGYNFLTSITNGYLLDMTNIPNVDYTNPWWNETVMDVLSIAHRKYGTPSDITVNDEKTVCCIYFNKDMTEAYGMGDLYSLVQDGTWTYDQLFSLAQMVPMDLDGNGNWDYKDQYGITHIRDSVNGIFASVDIQVAGKDENDLPIYTFQSDQNFTRYIDIFSKLYEKDVCYNYHQRLGAETEQTMFMQGQALFCMGGIYYAPSMRLMDGTFGILPFPKYEEAQAQYISTMDPMFMTLTCIPVSNMALEDTGIFLEYYAYLGHTNILPAFYDVLLTGKIVRDEESVEMLDLIFASLQQDIGGTFNFGGLSRELLLVCDRYSLDVASLAASYQKKVENDIEKLIEALTEE